MSDLFNEKQEENVSNNEESLSLNMPELEDSQAEIDADDYDSPIEEYHKEDSVSYNDELNDFEKYTDVNPSEPKEENKTFSYMKKESTFLLQASP